MFFDGWMGLLRVGVVGVLAYAALIILLQVSGKRTLSKMNAFDFIVTVALGSTLATVLLSETVALFEGVAAFVLLIGMQYAITWLSVRSGTVQKLVKSEPSLLFHDGDFLEQVMKRERVTRDEVRAAVRQQGKGSMAEVNSVILETDGTFSVISSPMADSMQATIKNADAQTS
ncbi:MAG: FIG00989832: hypothetical protein [uncultured Chloroflexia bacterium]|uniref:DUF421 domain-containing protein n=1 Tax=uncultured Chloroflexia bacterium TaxID=1672391 RepID=A0A6J4KNF3_9CHLR|nr:MAG: FIG00989832: hypothetical protein [uncultured Chloroflexia bacterium]